MPADLEETIELTERAKGVATLIYTDPLPNDAAAYVKIAAAHLEQAHAFFALAALSNSRDLAERMRGR